MYSNHYICMCIKSKLAQKEEVKNLTAEMNGEEGLELGHHGEAMIYV